MDTKEMSPDFIALLGEIESLKDEIEELRGKVIPSINLKTKEEILLLIPDVIGNVMMQHAVNRKVTSEFYKKHPEFKKHGKVVASVVGELDTKHPGLAYDKLMDKAAPIITERIKVVDALDTASVSEKPNLDVKVPAGPGTDPDKSNGAI
jgi:hypothetical protein